MSALIQVQTTTAARVDALQIAQALVQQRLAACVQIAGPITSVYRWEGKVETAEEWLCIAKTRADLYAQVEAAIRRLHKYQTPEVLALPISQVSDAYAQWVDEETSPTSSEPS
jgi:periplasmic divalent cation tolerance protein